MGNRIEVKKVQEANVLNKLILIMELSPLLRNCSLARQRRKKYNYSETSKRAQRSTWAHM